MNQRKALRGEWPVMNGLEDKQNLSALNVQLDRNSGLPTRGDRAPRRANMYPWRSQEELRGMFLSQRLT